MTLIDRRAPVGVLDSGVGGLTVVRQMKRLLPKESVLYLGDTGRLPYGPRPRGEVRRFTREIAEFLLKKGAKAIVIACNTATAAALDLIEKSFPGPVVGVIGPGARGAVLATGGQGPIGLIATQGTVESGAYDKALSEIGVKEALVKKACPEFVFLVEEGLKDPVRIRRTVKESLEVFHHNRVGALIMGCTHFPLLESYIAQELPGVTLVDPAVEAVRELDGKLRDQGLMAPEDNEPVFRFFTSGDVEGFRANLETILGAGSYAIERVTWPS